MNYKNKTQIEKSFESQFGGSVKIKQISCGGYHTCILMENNDVYACGYNSSGQLGLGDIIHINKFEKVSIDDIEGNIKQICCGGRHTFILMENNDIYACGYNEYGQLGLGDITHINIFEKVNIDGIEGNVKQIECGFLCTFVLMENNDIYASGSNSSGQLGLSDIVDRFKFEKVNIDDVEDNIKEISCGLQHTFILMENNDIYACGNNNSGHLGIGDMINKSKFEKVNIEGLEDNIKQICCGYNTTFILAENNSIYACGYNEFGQLGTGDRIDRKKFVRVHMDYFEYMGGNIEKISCGDYHTVVLVKRNNSNDMIYVCGKNSSGQLGQNDTEERSRFTMIQAMSKIKEVECGNLHTFMLMEDESAYACGENGNGQLGLGNNINYYEFEEVKIGETQIHPGAERQLFQQDDETPIHPGAERQLFQQDGETPIQPGAERQLFQQDDGTPIQQINQNQNQDQDHDLNQYPDVVVSIEKDNIFEQLYIFFSSNRQYINEYYWKKLNLSNFPEAIKLRFEFKDERGIDYGGIRGKVFYKIKDELSGSSNAILFCGKTENFVCVNNDNKVKQNYNYCYFLGEILALFYKNNLNLNWAPNPFLAFKLLFNDDMDEHNLKRIINYCYCVKKKFNLRMYAERHENLFKKICNVKETYNNCIDDDFNCHEDNYMEELENLGVLSSYSDIIKLEYYENPSNFKYIDKISEGFKSICKPKTISTNTKDNIRYIDEFIRTLYGNFDVKIDLILDRIDIKGNFVGLSNEESGDKIKLKIKEYLENDDYDEHNEDEKHDKSTINKARKLYGYFTGNLALDYDKLLSINIQEIANDFEEHSCGNNICLKSSITNIDDYLNRLIMNIDTYSITETKTQIAGYRGNQKINYKKKYLKYLSKFNQ
jgi:alpha-tubulin suppressor-like RCC1 family protein